LKKQIRNGSWLVRSLRVKFNLIVFVIVMAFAIKVPLLAIDVKEEVEVKKYHPKLESILGDLAEKYSQSRLAMQEFAQQRSICLEDDQVRVILVPRLNDRSSKSSFLWSCN